MNLPTLHVYFASKTYLFCWWTPRHCYACKYRSARPASLKYKTGKPPAKHLKRFTSICFLNVMFISVVVAYWMVMFCSTYETLCRKDNFCAKSSLFCKVYKKMYTSAIGVFHWMFTVTNYPAENLCIWTNAFKHVLV